jgi:CRISPR system Cascade subunit CasA
MFRVQLAALALDNAGLLEPPRQEAAWRDLLLSLTGGATDPWLLVGVDRSCPAFLQPPDPGGLKWEPVPTPDALDLLITSRNHDLKAAVAVQAAPEDWIYALVSLQTSDGYSGRGNFGIARMNGGSSSRVMFGLAPAGPGGRPDPSSWWRRDLDLILRHRNAPTVLTRGGLGLLWTLDWPEGCQIPAAEMDPLAIEVCRRIRLTHRNGEISGERATSLAARVDAKDFAGVLDDPWAPVTAKGANPKALTLGEGGRFHYRRIVDLLSENDWRIPLAARLDESEEAGDMVIVAEALARGNAKTGGLQSRIVPIPKQVCRGTGFPETLSTIAQEQIVEIEKADAALREAVALYAAGGDHDRLGKRERQWAAEARARLDAFVDRIFFDHLWARIHAMETGLDAQGTGATFRAALVEKARTELTRSFSTVPCARIRAPCARMRAGARLANALLQANLVEIADA